MAEFSEPLFNRRGLEERSTLHPERVRTRAVTGASSMRAAGHFRYSFQRGFVGFREGGGNRTLMGDLWADNRVDEAGSLRARLLDAVVCNEAAHDIQAVSIDGTGESFELIR